MDVGSEPLRQDSHLLRVCLSMPRGKLIFTLTEIIFSLFFLIVVQLFFVSPHF